MKDQQDASAFQILVSVDPCHLCARDKVVFCLKGGSSSTTCTVKIHTMIAYTRG